MTSIPRKSYDTDILTIRKFFLRNPINNVPISSGYLMFANVDGIGYMNPSSLSTSLQTQQGLSSLSSLIGTNFFITQSALSTLSTSIGTGGGGSGDVTVANLASTTRGLGSAGYLSSLTGFQISTGFVQASTVNFIDTGDSSKQVMEVNNGTLKINGATIAGGGGISQSQLNSTLNGLGTLNFLSTLTLTSTIIGLGTAGYISTAGANQESITSTLQGLGSAGYLSTVSFSNVISTSFYDTNTSSTIKGLGTTGYLSSIQWSNVISTSFYDTNTTSTVEGLGTFGYLSSIQWSNVISTSFYDTNTSSTIKGLGTFGYLSTLSSLGVSTGTLTANKINLIDQGVTPNLLPLTVLDNALYFNGSPVGSGNIFNTYNNSTYLYQVSSASTIFIQNGAIAYISQALNVYLYPDGYSSIFFSTGQVATSSIQFIDTQLNIPQLLAVTNGNLQLNGASITGDFTQTNANSTIRGLGSLGYYSTLSELSTVRGLGTAGYLSTVSFSNVISTSFFDTNTASTVRGLGTVGYLSSIQWSNVISTSFFDTNLGSTVRGLGTAGYYSTLSEVSTVRGLGTAGYLSTVSFSNVISTSFFDTNLGSTVRGLGTLGYLSTVSFSNIISTSFFDTNIGSTIRGLGTTGYLSSLEASQGVITSTLLGLGTFGYLSSIQWSNVISTSFYDTNTTSTVEGLGTFGYLSTLSLLSTVGRLQTITNSTIGGWAYTPASSDILLNTNITTRLKNTNPNAVLQIESLDVSIQDPLSAWANLDIGTLNLKTSSSDEYYTLGFNPIATGTISSFLIARYNGLVTAPAGLYISSLFLGNFGGTTNGQLTTDETATDIYWNNSKLNSQTGGGGGTVSFTFVSTNSLSSIFVSSGTSFFNYNSTKTTTADVLNFSSLFVNNIPILVDSNGNLLVTSQTI